MRILQSLLIVGGLLLASPSSAQTAKPAPAPAPAGDRITPEQARQAIETLQNDAKRNEIINTRRDPIDSSLSAFTKLFKDDMPHSYDMGELGRYYRQYDALMKHWEDVLPAGVLKVVEYENVVENTEKEARGIIEFLGLDWDEKMLEFHKSSRPVKTASVAQVRKPIYKTAVKRWKKYGAGLQPLIDAIEKA